MADVIGKLILRNVRLSFPHIYEPQKVKQKDGSTRESYGAAFLIPEAELDSPIAVFNNTVMGLRDAIEAANAETLEKVFGSNRNDWPEFPQEKTYFRDGRYKKKIDGYAGHWYIAANSRIDSPPSVLTNRKDGNGKWIPAVAGGHAAPYAGCYVNAIVAAWAQDSDEYGQRLNCELKSVQFYKDGQSFSAGAVDPNEDFTDDMVGEEGGFGVMPDSSVIDDDDVI